MVRPRTAKAVERVAFTTKLNSILLKQFKTLAIAQGVSINDLLEDAMREMVKTCKGDIEAIFREDGEHRAKGKGK